MVDASTGIQNYWQWYKEQSPKRIRNLQLLLPLLECSERCYVVAMSHAAVITMDVTDLPGERDEDLREAHAAGYDG